jgi:hypothetical protein
VDVASVLAPSVVELLEWVDGADRSYADAMEVWGSWCPRHSAWEDAIAERLIMVQRGEVTLTGAGRAALLPA